VRLRLAAPADAAAIAAIYAPYVTDSAISFEATAPDAATIAERMAAGGDLYPWLAACGGDGGIVGYAYASAFRPRHAYRFAVETTVYVAQGRGGAGIGGALYGALLALLEAQGFLQAIGAITLPNPASVALHEAAGFVRVGRYDDIGWKRGGWHDVGLFQRRLAPPADDPPAEPRPYAPLWSDQLL
jgi:phosphinothricin acetyltransferase